MSGRPGVDLGLMRELADAVDKDRGHSKSLLTRMMRDAADEIRSLRSIADLADNLVSRPSGEDTPAHEGNG